MQEERPKQKQQEYMSFFFLAYSQNIHWLVDNILCSHRIHLRQSRGLRQLFYSPALTGDSPTCSLDTFSCFFSTSSTTRRANNNPSFPCYLRYKRNRIRNLMFIYHLYTHLHFIVRVCMGVVFLNSHTTIALGLKKYCNKFSGYNQDTLFLLCLIHAILLATVLSLQKQG